MASSLFSRRKPRHRHRPASPVIKTSTKTRLPSVSPAPTSTTLGDFSRIFASLHSNMPSCTSTPAPVSTEQVHRPPFSSLQPHNLTRSQSPSPRLLFFIPDHVIRETITLNGSKEPAMVSAKTPKPELMTTSTSPRTYDEATTSFPPSPPLSVASRDSLCYSESAPSTSEFHHVDLRRDGGAPLSDITTPPATPSAHQASSPDSSDGLDLAGERLLKKQIIKRPRPAADEPLNARLIRHFGAHDQSLRDNFPEQYANGIHEFYDGSNITVSFYNAEKKRRGMDKKDYLPAFFSLSAFRDVLERGRPVGRRFIAGSRNKMGVEPQYLLQARCLGFETKVFDRVRKFATSSDSEDEFQGMQMREQGVDELVHLGMAESLLDQNPGIMVLATGDGNVGEFSGGFPGFVIRALKRGWIVEVYSFAESAHSIWRDPSFINDPEWIGRLSFHPLDSFILDLIDLNKDQVFYPASSAAASSRSSYLKRSKTVKVTKTINLLEVDTPGSGTIPPQTAAAVERAPTPAAQPAQASPANLSTSIPSPQRSFAHGATDHYPTYVQQLAQSYMASSQYKVSLQSYTSQILGGYDYAAALARDSAIPVTSPSWS